MGGIESLGDNDTAKKIAASGDPQAIMSALTGQAGVDPYRVLAAVKRQTDQQQAMQAMAGQQAMQRAAQTPPTTVAQELIGSMRRGIGAHPQDMPQGAPQTQRFAGGGAVVGFPSSFSAAWQRDPQFRNLAENRGVSIYSTNEEREHLFNEYYGLGKPARGPSLYPQQIPGGLLSNLPKGMPDLPMLERISAPPLDEVKPAQVATAKIAGPSVRDRLRLKPYTVEAAQLQSPEEMSAEEIRSRQDKLSEAGMAEFDAAMNPLAARRKEIYERQKANRPTARDNTIDGILGVDIRGRRLGSGLAAMASSGRKAQREADKLAVEQDVAQLQAEELLARARIEVRKGNREEAMNLINAARRTQIEKLGITNRQAELNAGAKNQTGEIGFNVQKANAELQAQYDRMANERAIAEARINEDRTRRLEDKTDQKTLRALQIAQSDPAYKKAADIASQFGMMINSGATDPKIRAQYDAAIQQMEAIKYRILQSIDQEGRLGSMPSASSGPGVTTYDLFPKP